MLSRLTTLLPGWMRLGEATGAADRGAVRRGTVRTGTRASGTRAAATSVQPFDETLLWVVALLLGLGLVMVYSASIAVLERRDPSGDASTYYLIRQSAAIGVALVAGLFAYAVPPRRWQQIAMPLFFVGVVLLALVFVPGIGKRAGGAYRWLSLGVTTLQPTELMKLFVVLYVADYAVRKQALMPHLWRAFSPRAASCPRSRR